MYLNYNFEITECLWFLIYKIDHQIYFKNMETMKGHLLDFNAKL